MAKMKKGIPYPVPFKYPVAFKWIAVKYECSGEFTLPMKTSKYHKLSLLRNFDETAMTIEVFYPDVSIWYKAEIIANSGKFF